MRDEKYPLETAEEHTQRVKQNMVEDTSIAEELKTWMQKALKTLWPITNEWIN